MLQCTVYRSVTGDAGCYTDDLGCSSVQYMYRSVTGASVCYTNDLGCCSVMGDPGLLQ